MKKAIAIAVIFGVAACGGEKPKLATVAENPNASAIAAPVEPAKTDPDKELAQRVVRAMRDAKLLDVDAVAAGGVVTLWGSAPTVKEVGLAGQIATKVPGVKAVDNRLEIVTGS